MGDNASWKKKKKTGSDFRFKKTRAPVLNLAGHVRTTWALQRLDIYKYQCSEKMCSGLVTVLYIIECVARAVCVSRLIVAAGQKAGQFTSYALCGVSI